MKDVEIWKDIYNGLYAVSSLGRVKAKERTVATKTGIRKYTERILIPETTSDGHLRVTLCDTGIKTRVFVHRLVAESFIPNPMNFLVVNHKDENPSNNRVDNLEWCTVLYNNTYNDRHKRIGSKESVQIYVLNHNMECIDTVPSLTMTSKKYNIPIATLCRYIKNKKEINGKIFVKAE